MGYKTGDSVIKHEFVIPKLPGIYVWRNRVNNKTYLGSAKNLYKRYTTHISSLRRNKNKYGCIQDAYNKYGESNMQFSILLICELDSVIQYEQLLLTKLKPEYNKRLVAYSNIGLRASDETRAKQRLAHVNRKYPEFESTWKSPYYKTHSMKQETKDKISISLTGKHRPDNVRLKIGKSHVGRVMYYKTLLGRLISPNGSEFSNIDNISAFGREHGIDYRRMSEFFSGSRLSWNGWKYERGDV